MHNIFVIKPQHVHSVDYSFSPNYLDFLARRRDISQIEMEMLNVTKKITQRTKFPGSDFETYRLASILNDRVADLNARLRRRRSGFLGG